MAHRLRLMSIVAVALLTSVAMAQGQDKKYVPYAGGSNSSAGANATAQTNGQQQGYGTQGQSQTGNQNQGMTGTPTPNQNQNQNQGQNNQGQGDQEAAPPKPRYLTFTAKKQSLEEQVKTGKALAVDFKSVPAGAAVTVDGYYVGKTPITTQIPTGKHLVSITKWGFETWQQELDVAEGKALSVNPALHRDW